MRRSDNFSISTFRKKEHGRLEELRKEKEKILEEMKIREERKKKKLVKETKKELHMVKNNITTEPLIENKIQKDPKFQTKSFNEIMQEANEREQIKKRKLPTNSHTIAKKQKVSINETSHFNRQILPSDKRSDILSINKSSKKDNSPIMAQNSIKKQQKPTIQNKYNSKKKYTESQSQNQKFNKQDEFKMSSQNNNRGIVAQNSKKSISVGQLPNRGIISQSGFKPMIPGKNHKPLPVSSNCRGILAQNGVATQQYLSGSEEEEGSDLEGFIDDSERMLDDDIKKEIYQSLGFDPTRYAKVSYYDDCKNMESSSKQIQIEESQSMKVAKQEDLKEARLEMQRLKKKGKL